MPTKTITHPHHCLYLYLYLSIYLSLSLALLATAKPFSRSLELQMNYLKMKSMQGLIVFSVLLLIMIQKSAVGAIEFKVGGEKGWSLPSDNSNALTYNQWAEMNRFQVGDSLLFVYQPDNDLVMHVNNVDYTNCNTATPIVTYSDGKSVFTFNQSGPFHFISGIRENCLKNEKLVVVVMADRSGDRSSNSNQTTSVSPSPAPSDSTTSPAPSGEIEIVPAPDGMQFPSSPPTDSIVLSPTSAPAGLESPQSSSSPVKFASLIVSIGAFVGSLVFLDL
ncbi:hypothetical protein MKW94_013275 [Papaver nudicaule]|uniref:Phytocyanin domain-containing protein n=1 Tax=Papaver nudicaule TaxID=74823 RepID=A0AA41RPE8_PAPNU|nr:hypothetical protein [Papaver nudicaule]